MRYKRLAMMITHPMAFLMLKGSCKIRKPHKTEDIGSERDSKENNMLLVCRIAICRQRVAKTDVIMDTRAQKIHEDTDICKEI